MQFGGREESRDVDEREEIAGGEWKPYKTIRFVFGNPIFRSKPDVLSDLVIFVTLLRLFR